MENPGLIQSGKKGYSINREMSSQILEESEEDQIPQTMEERSIYVLNQLVTHSRNKPPIDLYDLCDELYISLSTLKLVLNRVKKSLAKYDLELQIQNNAIRVEGSEKNKRRLLSGILYKESEINFVNMEFLQQSFEDIDVDFIRRSILDVFGGYHYYIHDYSLMNLILHMVIAIDRLQSGRDFPSEPVSLEDVPVQVMNMATDLARRFEERFAVNVNETELYEIALMMMAQITNVEMDAVNKRTVASFVGEDVLALVDRLVEELKNYCFVILKQEEFYTRFALHIKNLLFRARTNTYSKNPLAQSVKVTCPLIYDTSVMLAKMIVEMTGLSINDDEIAYIAFHLGGALETQKAMDEKVSAILYDPGFYGLNEQLSEDLKKYFDQDLLITHVVTDESQISKIQGNDLLITTMPLSHVYPMTTIQVSFILTNNDQRRLSDMLRKVQLTKRQNRFARDLEQIIQEDLFLINKGIRTDHECINLQTEQMVRQGYVPSTFREEILERERMSSTALGSFAIPHAMKMRANKTGISVLIGEGIEWGEKSVDLVLMMCFRNNERYIFNQVFDPITVILSEPENVRLLTQATSRDEFIRIMAGCMI